MERHGSADVNATLRQALAAHQQGQFAHARAGYEEVLRLQPLNFEALHMLGILSCQMRETQKGINFFLRAIALDPGHAAAHCNIGNAYKALGRTEEARASYDRAIEIKPDFAEAYYNRGNTLKDLRRREEAVESYDAAVAIRPDLAEAYSNRGIALSDLNRASEALASHDRAIQLRPDHAPAHLNRGNALSDLGRLEEALTSYGRAIALRPGFAQAHINQGNALTELGRFDLALASFVEAFRIDPDLVEGLNNFSALLRHVELPDAPDEIRKLVIRCLESPAVESEAVARTSAAMLLHDLQKPMKDGAGANVSASELDGLTGGLLIAHLANCPIMDRQLEVFLTGVRERLLFAPRSASRSASEQHPESEFLIALARQGFMNEYVWRVTGTELDEVTRIEQAIEATIATQEAPAIRDLLLLAAYRPVHQQDAIRSWCIATRERFSPEIKATVSHLVANPALEARLDADIERLTLIEDAVSVAVRSQYEESPYPRWESLGARKRAGYTRQILDEVAPNRPDLRPATNAPAVLIAGCGSGKHALSSALRLDGSDVLAIDLSRKSLAYARRKADEMNVTNARFAQADILNLPAVGARFEVIECIGVLHHMADPGAGLDALLSMLNPGGYIKLGLYSQLARRYVVRLRELAAAQGLPVTRDSVRSLREALLEADTPEVRAILKSHDFYSTSTVRDLLFHVHEQRFSLPEVDDLIRRAGLEFLGFVSPDPLMKRAYARQFHDDPDCIDLRNWHRFETANPDTFTGMYQFWCRKPA